LIRFLLIIINCVLVVLVSSACGGAFDSVAQTNTQSNQSGSPTMEISRTATPTIKQATENEVPETTATLIPETETPFSTQTATLTPTATISSPKLFPDPAEYEWRLVVSGLRQPIGLANAWDDSGRLFILEQAGLIRILQEGQLLVEPFIDITNRVSCCGERGLLGLAFHPQYRENGLFFLNYTDLNGDSVIARFQVSEEVNRANPDSEVKLLVVEQPFANHNGGGLAFGPDGYLYIGLGDGGSGGDPLGNAQNKTTLLGKLLRLDVDQGDPYGIPPDNPFAHDGGAPEVWAYGLRNPWRLTFDRLTGELFIGDVGQGSWEEIDYVPAGYPGGINFGWNFMEGAHPYGSSTVPEDVELTAPVALYGRDQGYSVTGGVVYRGAQLPDWGGIYFYGDYGSGLIWGLLRAEDGSWQNRVLFQTGASITSFGEDDRGEVFFVSYQGALYQFVNR
jgi:glucose/arabinose dehydrogenase